MKCPKCDFYQLSENKLGKQCQKCGYTNYPKNDKLDKLLGEDMMKNTGEFQNIYFTEEELIDITADMITYGGSFAKAIGTALLHADNQNKNKLVNAFSELLQAYKGIIK